MEGVPSPNRETIATVADLRDIAHSHRVVIGHYSALSLLEAGCSDLALQVREPRARLLSLYRYWQSQPDSVRTSWGIWGQELVGKADLPLREFLTSPCVWPAVDNLLVRQTLAYRPKTGKIRVGRSNFSGLYSAFAQLPLIVEWSARSQQFMERLCEQIGASPVPVLARENATEVTEQEQKIDGALMRLLRRFTRADRMFLEKLSRDGFLAKRSRSDLNREFEETATRLGFRLG
jgi:hypothetical protein